MMGKTLERISERVWILPFEDWRDRPNIGYIRGDRFSIAVDAGHSGAHVNEFYDRLREEDLPLPDLTVITHWHWDHTFGMHAINGLSIANSRTNKYLHDYRENLNKNGTEGFLSMYDAIRNEYQGNAPVIVTTADIVFDGEMAIDPGGCSVKLICSDAPHTDDSTLVFVQEEGVLFIGDSTCGSFPEWKKEEILCRSLHDRISSFDVNKVVSGHWNVQTKKEALEDLLAGCK